MIKLQTPGGPTPEMTESLDQISLMDKDDSEGAGGFIR